MPLYEYRCEQRHRYEKREPFGSPPNQPCERCGKPAQRVLHAPAIAFKGSGWYRNDSRGSEPTGKIDPDGGGTKKSKKTAGTNNGANSASNRTNRKSNKSKQPAAD